MKPGASDDTHTHVARARRSWSSLVLGGLVLAALLSTRWVRLNLSPSVPRGLYRLTAVRASLTRGTLVVLPVPARVRPWQAAWVPLLKPIAGVAGDVVCHTDHTLFVNGADFGPVYQAAHGQPLPQIAEGGLVVPEGDVFLASPAPKSLDGRYMGPVRVSTPTARAVPFLTWRSPWIAAWYWSAPGGNEWRWGVLGRPWRSMPARKAISCFSAYRLCCRPRYMTNGCRAYPQAKEGRMDHSSLLYSLRSRAGPFLPWLIGSTQTRQQVQQSDRQQAEGVLRRQDDPDARQRQAFTPDAGLTLRERFQAWAGHQAHQSATPEPLRQHLDAQQRQPQQQQRQQRGGWGYGR